MFSKYFILIFVSLIVYSNAGGPGYEDSSSEFYSPTTASTTANPCPPVQEIETNMKTYKEDIAEFAKNLSLDLKKYAADYNKANNPTYEKDIKEIWKKYSDQIDTKKGQIISDIYYYAPNDYVQDCIEKYKKIVNDIYKETMKETQKRYNSLLN
ncbi:hypothetical protein PVAND_017178 [Polypedilum vanderplanki]|uniref:Uncharacterized protein n=1 Tax=Polypedilum vanderplanki TaxID=319348 RepID=A0A9J6BHZ4_POLVA|nr:hypothetical protein PVAND_017178 [Polypedilum vanderplanki]